MPFLAAALLDAFEATFEPSYFDLARQLTATLLGDFWDEANGGFFFTGRNHETLIDRVKSATDQAIPSGTAIATRNLLRLYAHTGESDYLQRAESVLRLYRQHMEQQPFGYGSLLSVCADYLQKAAGNRADRYPRRAGHAGSAGRPAPRLRAAQDRRADRSATRRRGPRRPAPATRTCSPARTQIDGKATVYVCRDFACSLPVTEPAELAALLGRSCVRRGKAEVIVFGLRAFPYLIEP